MPNEMLTLTPSSLSSMFYYINYTYDIYYMHTHIRTCNNNKSQNKSGLLLLFIIIVVLRRECCFVEYSIFLYYDYY